jgi:hypothetical protein
MCTCQTSQQCLQDTLHPRLGLRTRCNFHRHHLRRLIDSCSHTGICGCPTRLHLIHPGPVGLHCHPRRHRYMLGRRQ